MASKTSGSRTLKKNTFPKFEAVVYSNIPSNELIVFSVHYLIEQKIEITLEDVVSICFLLFPQKFGLKKFQKWPDSALVIRHWSDSRKKGFISVNADPGYKLTFKGLNIVKRVAKILGVTSPKPAVKVQAQPKKKNVYSIEKTQPTINKGKSPKSIKQVRKVKVLTAKSPAVIQKKLDQLFKEEKVTPPSPTKKAISSHLKKVSHAPVKQITAPEIKAQPVLEKKVVSPAPVKKIQPAPTKKVSPAPAPVKQIPAPEIKAQPILEKKVVSLAPVKKIQPTRTKKVSPAPAPVKQIPAPEIKAQPVQEKKVVPHVPTKKIRPTRAKKVSPVPTSVKQIQVPEIKILPAALEGKKQDQPVSKPAKKVQPIAPTKIAETTQVKKTKPAKSLIIRQIKAERVQAEKESYIAPVNVAREEKERAGKFTRMMERSDAYIHYKKNGGNSKINEFDFRSLLLCTMESSAETLARNVSLFKGYASIHNRQDLIVFLIFCEDKFSHLLKPQNKSLRKAKK